MNLSKRGRTEAFYFDFWNGFTELCKAEGTFLGIHKPSKRHYFTIGIGREDVTISVTASFQKRRLGCEIYLSGDNAKRAYKLLENDKRAIEEKTGDLDWQELRAKQDCRIVLYRYDVDIKDKATWDDAYVWLKSKAELFHRTFSPFVKALPR